MQNFFKIRPLAYFPKKKKKSIAKEELKINNGL